MEPSANRTHLRIHAAGTQPASACTASSVTFCVSRKRSERCANQGETWQLIAVNLKRRQPSARTCDRRGKRLISMGSTVCDERPLGYLQNQRPCVPGCRCSIQRFPPPGPLHAHWRHAAAWQTCLLGCVDWRSRLGHHQKLLLML